MRLPRLPIPLVPSCIEVREQYLCMLRATVAETHIKVGNGAVFELNH